MIVWTIGSDYQRLRARLGRQRGQTLGLWREKARRRRVRCNARRHARRNARCNARRDARRHARRAPQGVARVCVPHVEYHPTNHLVDFSASFGLLRQGQSALEGRSGDNPARGGRILRLL